jgi:RNA polymerase sigma-70 factor (ECF subfamily)
MSTTRDPRRSFEVDVEPHRAELTGYCYRMLGSPFDAEDAVQETLTRAWRGLDRFEGRASIRTWLYRIAGNVCFDMIDAGARRARPMDLSGAGTAEGPLTPPLPESTWIEPIPDARWTLDGADPVASAQARESLRLAFVAALQHLPPRQRAVLILREVLGFRAAEVAQQLDTSVASVNSALQRARATLDAREDIRGELADAADPDQRALLARYMDAFERYDIDALTSLLHEDAVQSMPPYPLWLRGRDQVLAWWTGPGAGCRGSRLVPTTANGLPAFGQYRASGPGGRHEPWALQVLEIEDGVVVGFTAFLDTETLFPLFGLPAHPDG